MLPRGCCRDIPTEGWVPVTGEKLFGDGSGGARGTRSGRRVPDDLLPPLLSARAGDLHGDAPAPPRGVGVLRRERHALAGGAAAGAKVVAEHAAVVVPVDGPVVDGA